uniref:Pseudouridylate synthase RPUSD4, mitochondrial n=1 Tax=Sinocyclocheilus anshuiensis TaxID=1608454 RepID=A0A671T544_9TELE
MRHAASQTEAVASNGKTGLKAADIANRLRSEKEKRANDKKEVPVSPLQNRLQSVHTSVLAKALFRGILYQDKNIIAINKPYGVPLHNVDGIRNSIVECLPLLAKITDGMQAGSQLHLCHSLEKENTGVLILAKTEEAAEHVQTLIRSHNVERKYFFCLLITDSLVPAYLKHNPICFARAVTVGVPVPSEGVIDIPIIEKEVTGPQPHFKMGLSPLFKVSEEGDGVTRVRSHWQAQSAVTQYRVLDSTSGCSLVELQPVTGVKNQLRVHMALALTCTILGDHKYAHWNKLAPQLGLVQSKTRYLPLHLHSRRIILPGVKGHSDITVSCPLPKYFTNTLKRLQIPLPGKE